jgi:hypothetical protein
MMVMLNYQESTNHKLQYRLQDSWQISAHLCRYMHGENDIDHMNLVELQTLENNLEMWANNIRSQKVRFIRFLIDEIFFFKKKNSICEFIRCTDLIGWTDADHLQGDWHAQEQGLVQYLSLCSCNKAQVQQFPSPKVLCVSVLQEAILQAVNGVLQERVLQNLRSFSFIIFIYKEHSLKDRIRIYWSRNG